MAMTDELLQANIRKILDMAVYAPSGSNSQPWKFIVRDNAISIIATPEKDHPVFNYRNRGTYVAHGALIENIIIAAPHFGYRPRVIAFPDKNNLLITAEIILDKSDIAKSDLFDAIVKRATNRRPYKKNPLTKEEKTGLFRDMSSDGAIQYTFIENPEQIRQLGQAISANEIIMLENKKLHRAFFDELVWTQKEEEIKRTGLYLRTLELDPPQAKALSLFKYWPVMRFANILGMSRKIANENANVYSACSGMTVFFCPDDDKEFIEIGRRMQRLWLRATAMGLSAQPVIGLFYMWQSVELGKQQLLSAAHMQLMDTANRLAVATTKIPSNMIIAMLLRIGYGGEPSARSSRKSAEYTI